MKRNIALPLLLAVVTIVLVIIAYIILPEQVIIQFTSNSLNPTTAPKLLALLVPTALGVGGAMATIFSKSEDKQTNKSLVISIIGVLLAILMIIINVLIIK